MDVQGKKCDRCGKVASGDGIEGFVSLSVNLWAGHFRIYSDRSFSCDLCRECGAEFARGTIEALKFHIEKKHEKSTA